MKKRLGALVAFASLVTVGSLTPLVACGGNPPPPAPAPSASASVSAADDHTLRPVTQGQLKVAHYATPDGTLGFVLDRTADPAKVQLDGSKDIIELTMVEDRFGGERRGFYLKSPDGKNVLYLGVGGDISLFTARDQLPVNSDKAAPALAAATVTGQWHAPKSAYDALVEQLKPLAVRPKLAQSNPEDSGNLTKLADVLSAVDPSSYVRVNAVGAAAAKWAPASRHIGNVIQGLGGPLSNNASSVAWDPKAKSGLKKYGGILVDDHPEYDRPSRLHMQQLAGWPPPLAVDTPGIVWDIDNGALVFVTLDGGRYEIWISSIVDQGSPVTAGLTPIASWPPPLQHMLVDVESVRALAKAAAIPKETGASIEALDDGWWSCVNAQWVKTKKLLDATEASSLPANDKWGKLSGIQKSAELTAVKTCAPNLTKLDQGLSQFIEARDKDRLALLDKAKARAVASGAAK